MNVTWPSNVYNQDEWQTYEMAIPAQAYMDDTSFLGRDWQDLQASIDIANQFYKIHDIFINGKKCELMVINPSIPPSQQYIIIGQDHTIITATKKEIRYLEFRLQLNNHKNNKSSIWRV